MDTITEQAMLALAGLPLEEQETCAQRILDLILPTIE